MPLVFSKSLVWVLSTLLWPGSPQRERIAVDTELWRTLHVWSAICERFNPSTCRCGAFECRPLAQIAICRMRQLNCGSSSRFRIHLGRMWVKTNRTKTEPMDINIGYWLTFDIRTDLTHHHWTPSPKEFTTFPCHSEFFFPGSLRWGLDLREFEPVTLLGE